MDACVLAPYACESAGAILSPAPERPEGVRACSVSPRASARGVEAMQPAAVLA